MKAQLLVHAAFEAVAVPQRSRERPNPCEHYIPRAVTMVGWLPAESGRGLSSECCFDRGGQTIPAVRLLSEPAAAGSGEAVILGPAVVLRRDPLGFEQPLVLEPVERWIESSLLHEQRAIRDLLDSQQHAVSVQLAERDRLQDQQVEGAGKQVGLIGHRVLFLSALGIHPTLLSCQGKRVAAAATTRRASWSSADAGMVRRSRISRSRSIRAMTAVCWARSAASKRAAGTVSAISRVGSSDPGALPPPIVERPSITSAMSPASRNVRATSWARASIVSGVIAIMAATGIVVCHRPVTYSSSVASSAA